MEKIILQSAGAFEWRTEGVFDNIEQVIKWIEENYDISFEDFKKEVLEEEGYEPTYKQWFDELELQVIHTEEKPALNTDQLKIAEQIREIVFKDFEFYQNLSLDNENTPNGSKFSYKMMSLRDTLKKIDTHINNIKNGS
jgi:hypothetical protein